VYLGIDIGTSGVKAVLVDESGAIVAQASDSLDVSRPAPGFSEQDPEAWWHATVNAVRGLPAGAAIGGAGRGLERANARRDSVGCGGSPLAAGDSLE
jgi:xylulokinase